MNTEETIFAKELSLEEFLEKLISKDYGRLFPNNCFPTEEMMNEYLDNVSKRTDNEILSILRKFLIHNCTFGLDEFRAENYITKKDGKTYIASTTSNTEYNRRFLTKFLTNQGEVWEGLTWVIDLLPNFPNEAIKAIDAYFLANCQMLPDYSLNALSDSATIIRARYINYKHPKEILWNLNPFDFEYLIAALFENMGYEVSVTKSSYDNGVDVCANKTNLSQKEKVVVQCKRYSKKTIGVADIRELLGVISDKKVTKGILITTTKFSSEAKKFERNNPSIELIDCDNLMILLNTHLGTYWTKKLDKIINGQKINNNGR
ncbi:restriction endonuclease [Candidatus Woesearchaeota archaeon]|nr:restriction endonuclease [Candidatus Woesearchaeota archaeon]